MHKIAVISDSHGGKVRLEMFARLAQKERFDAVIHCGDGVSDAKWLAKTLGTDVQYVAGNCDFMGREPRELIAAFGQTRILAVHGGKYNVKWDLTQLSYYAEEKCVGVALFGHTHQAFAGYVGGVMLVNPGALNAGRYAVLQIENGSVTPFLKEL